MRQIFISSSKTGPISSASGSRLRGGRAHAATLLRIFSEGLKEFETPIADLRCDWEVATRNLSAKVNAYGATLSERYTLWWYPDMMKHLSPDDLSALVASANKHLDLLLEAHRNLEFFLAEIEGIWARDERPDELHRTIGFQMIRLDRALVSFRTRTVWGHHLRTSCGNIVPTAMTVGFKTTDISSKLKFHTRSG
ncbi:hypothetical protein FB45DRAFT_332638 [Roridomyces roridus]|uniref:Uncharacterized protein n=1 Tax=Roridomyces roridus TaxID=1738132 RepID=A0AAD7F9D9_9AGAR|nr:hypothetical protein FB45DRAFT_332638 [Roridomyces roridus]